MKKEKLPHYINYYFLRASALIVPPFSTGSDNPVSTCTLETGFFNSLSPICSSLFKFSFVAISTEDQSFPADYVFTTIFSYI